MRNALLRIARRHDAVVAALLVLVAGLVSRAHAAPTPADPWDPRRTWAFVVGVLDWKDGETWPAFPKTDRRDVQLEKVLERRGVPRDHIVALHDGAATREAVVKAWHDLLARTQPGDELIVYFCGHGDKAENGSGWFVTWDAGDDVQATTWPMKSIVTDVQTRFRGRRALLLADCCYSGTMAENARDVRGDVAVAALTSSSSSIASTGAWTFTESVIAGFNGSPPVDLDRDGFITLTEMAHYTFSEMRFADGQRAAFFTTPGYGDNESMAVTAGTAKPRQGEHLEVKTEGDWWKARVLDSGRRGLRVHYYGYETSDDAWVPLNRVRPVQVKTFAVGAAVQVKWKKDWYPATILKVQDGLHLVHYDGYADTWDEWVDARGIKRR